MSSERTCPKCHADLPGGDLEGLCPACVAQVAFVLEPEPALASMEDLSSTSHRHFGDYELLEEIARGGMGVVYRARQRSLNRTVAVKMILEGRLASPADVQRFRAEAEAAANLQDPHIVAIHEVGEQDGQWYFSMDYIEGQNLSQIVGAHGFSLALKSSEPAAQAWFRRAANWVKTLAESIHYAHERGTLHRDLKPSNILIDGSDKPHITDFGLAKRIKADSEMTITGQVLGTPHFMPPEQAAARHSEIGPASDVYSLGAVLYFLLTGKPPFSGYTTHEVIDQVLNREPSSPRTFQPGVPRELATICLKCLEKQPRARYSSAKHLAEDLGRFLQNEPILARPIGPAERIWRLARRHPASVALFCLLAMLLGFAVQRALVRNVVPDLPVLDAVGVSEVIDGKLYVAIALEGYEGKHNYLYGYDPDRNVWDKLRPTPRPPMHCASGAINGKLYLAGGGDWKDNITNQMDIYDPASNLWTMGKPMPTARWCCTGKALNGKLYVLGGLVSNEPIATVEIYDATLDTWSTGPSMHFPRASPRTAVIDNTIYVFEGSITGSGPPTEVVEVLDCRTGRWSIAKPMPTPRSSIFVGAGKGVIYIAGGHGSQMDETNLFEAYYPVTGTWETLPPMPAPSYAGSGAQFFNGKLWLLGGWTNGKDDVGEKMVAHNKIFIYDPVRKRWSTSGRGR
jgi:tRNA A-37 threonylcarbamoyl transferase component Bud32